MFKKLLIILPAIAILSGCATPIYRKPISIETKNNIYSDQIILNSNQRKLHAEPISKPEDDVNGAMLAPAMGFTSLAGGIGGGIGGLLGNMLASGIYKLEIRHAEKKMQPISQSFNNYDLIGYFKINLSEELNKIKWLKIKNSSLQFRLKESDEKKIAQQSNEDTVFFASVSYQMSYPLNAVKLEANIKIDKKIPKYGSFLTLYNNNFTYIYYLPKGIENSKAVKVWSDNNDQLIKNVLQDGSRIVAKQIVKDVDDSNSNLYLSMQDKKNINFIDDYRQSLSGKLISKNGDLYIIRMPDDTIYIVNENALSK